MKMLPESGTSIEPLNKFIEHETACVSMAQLLEYDY